MTLRVSMLALLGAALLAPDARAASLAGQVQADGAPVAAAWVQLNTGRLAVTDARGHYSFAQVPASTYALQVFAPAKEPALLTGVVPGKGRADASLSAAAAPCGLVHVKATTPDGALCPVRLVTRWRPADGTEWQTPADLPRASTLDGRGRPLAPAADDQSAIIPFGACLWTRGEAVIALPPGQAELTSSSGVLRRVDQQVVEVKPNEVAEVAVSVMLGSELGGAGWTNGAIGLCPGSGGPFLANIPLAAAICRAEGYDWVSLGSPYGDDPAQASPRQTALEVSEAGFAVWLAPESPSSPLAAPLLAVGQEQGLRRDVPGFCAAALLKRAAAIHPDPSDPRTARELAFAAVAGPASVPLLGLRLGSLAGEADFGVWTALLGRGLRIGCAAVGEASLSHERLPGPERTFTQTQGSREQAAVVDALRRGATFATTGPVLNLTLGDAGPGSTLPADDVTRIAELDAVLGCVPGGGLARLELVRSGRVVRTWDVAEVGPNHLQARLAIREREPAWFSLRAFGADPQAAACTSPIYLGSPPASPAAREARLSGTVVDAQTGQPVAGATVTATAAAGRAVSNVTDAAGRYAVVAPASATLEASHPRYVSDATDGADRSTASTRFAVWDCPEVEATMTGVTAQSLLEPTLFTRLEASLATLAIDFRLRPR